MRRIRLPQVGGYVIATVAVSATNFLAVPLLVRVLPADEFGRWSLLEPLAALLAPIATLGLTFGLIKRISHDGAPPLPTLLALTRRALPFLLLGGLVASIAAGRMSLPLAAATAFGLLVCAEAFMAMLLASFRASGRVLAFGSAGVVRGVALLAALVVAAMTGLLVDDVGDVVVWRLLAVLLGCGAGYAAVRIARDSAFLAREDAVLDSRLGDALRYGAPILVASLLGLVIEFADRFVLANYVSYAAIGHYVVHVKVAAILDPLLVQPFALWWPTARFERARDPDGGDAFFRSTASLMLTAMLGCGGALWLGAPVFFEWYAPGVTLHRGLLLPLLLAIVFRALATPLNVGGLTPGRTHWNAIGVLFGSVVNVVLCLVLIPGFGVAGAAWATLIGYVMYTVGLNAVSQRIRRVPFAYGRMPLLLAAALSEATLVGVWQPFAGAWQALVRVVAFTLLFLLTARLVLGHAVTSTFPLSRTPLQSATPS